MSILARTHTYFSIGVIIMMLITWILYTNLLLFIINSPIKNVALYLFLKDTWYLMGVLMGILFLSMTTFYFIYLVILKKNYYVSESVFLKPKAYYYECHTGFPLTVNSNKHARKMGKQVLKTIKQVEGLKKESEVDHVVVIISSHLDSKIKYFNRWEWVWGKPSFIERFTSKVVEYLYSLPTGKFPKNKVKKIYIKVG